jgi:CUG-BP- and ETR3-like factor
MPIIVPGVLKSKVFVGCIPTTTDENEVRQVLQRHGKLIGFFYCRDAVNSDRGFAFGTFSNESEAADCVSKLNGLTDVFDNSIRPVQVKLSCEKITHLDAGSVFVDPGKTLPSMSWEEYVSDEGYPYYYNKETGETVWDKPKFFVKQAEMPTPAAIMEAASLAAAGGMGAQNTGYGPLGANLFIFHVPADWNDEILRSKFESYGQLVSCRVSTDDAGRSRGFAFVSYSTRESAANAIQSMNGYPVGGKYLKVTVKQGEEDYAIAPSGSVTNQQSVSLNQPPGQVFNVAGNQLYNPYSR